MYSSFGLVQAFTAWHSIAVLSIMTCMSVYLLALLIIRLNFFRKMRVDSQKLMEETHRAISSHDKKALALLKSQRNTDPPVRILVALSLNNHELENHDLSEVLHVARIRQAERLTSGLAVFGTMATIAPFIGLLGTVMGIVESFNSLAQSGAAGPNVVASGVAAALWTTAAGLVVAIPAVVFYNLFKNKAKAIIVDMEVVSRELLIFSKNESVVAKLKAI